MKAVIESTKQVYEDKIVWVHPETGDLHRIEGPAIEWFSGAKEYWQFGVPHRVEGPALVWSDGSVEYYLEGRQFSESSFKERLLDYLPL